MDSKFLTESGWKAVVLKFKVKDNGLQKALAIYEKLPEDKLPERLKALVSVSQLAANLKKVKEVAALKDVTEYLDDVVGAAEAERKLAEVAAKAASIGPIKPPDAHSSRSSFVDSQVKEIPVTTKIIDQIYCYFPKKYKVISGYLSAGDLYWKVNYHWDAMRVWLEYAKDNAEMNEEEQKQLNEYYTTLMSNPPSQQGHFKVNKIGEPADTSSESKIEQRCLTLQKLKADLNSYSQKQAFASKKMTQKNVLEYALNPLALPKQSNHIYGWALDIAGDIAGAAKIAKSLGSTLEFKEHTHCHCEFKNGVKL